MCILWHVLCLCDIRKKHSLSTLTLNNMKECTGLPEVKLLELYTHQTFTANIEVQYIMKYTVK